MSCIVFVDNVSGTRKLLNFGFICVLTIVTSQTFAAPLVTFDSIDVGWYRNQGYHPDVDAALAGCKQTLWRWDLFASYFIFDLSSVSEEFQSGRLFVPIYMYQSSDAQESIVLYDIITPVSDVMASHYGANVKPSIFEDLRSGSVYGSTTVTAGDVGSEVVIDITSEALNSLNGNTGNLFGIGIYLNNLRGRNIEYVLFISAQTSDKARLELEILPEPEPMVYYVDDDANGLNDGSSWVNAFNDLQDALAAASSGDEIRVAQGIYKPDEDSAYPNGTGSRTATFQLKNGVAIKGGYAGFGEPDPNARDIEAYETILSGDIGWVDYRWDNSYHVVTGSGADSTAVLDGFIITRGNNNSYSENRYGGGMYNYEGSPTLNNCSFSANSASWSGAGMYNEFSNPTLTNCTFSGNSVEWGRGGGMCNSGGSPTLTNCTFSGNSVDLGRGGAMYNSGSSPMLTNCTFSGNHADDGGGGMYNEWDNNLILTNCTFSGNSARAASGGMFNYHSSPTLTNCLFVGNSADYWGGGMFNWESSPTLVNCTFSGNSAEYGGGMDNWDESRPTVTNCILWGNTAPSGSQIHNDGTSSATVSYSDVQGGWPGEGNIDADPLFMHVSSGDLRLLPASACIDAGDNTAVPADTTDLDGDGDTAEPIPFDLGGNPRFVDDPCTPDTGNGTAPIVDMGAYEANYIEVAMKFTPQALNLGSKGKWVKAHFVLPEEFSVEDVNTNTPAVIALLGIKSDQINVFINEDGLVEIEAAFSRSDFCALATSDDGTEVIVIGLLNSGRNFYGRDTIRIITKSLEYIAVLASHWLEGGCGAPDWCGGGDLDHNSMVDLVDFALFDGCCIEVIRQ